MPFWLQFIIMLSTTAGLGFAAFGIWAKYKERQFELGTSLRDLQDLVESQQQALERAERRFQNLEAIVTSHEWDDVSNASLPTTEKEPALPPGRIEIPDADHSTAEQAEQIARRLRT